MNWQLKSTLNKVTEHLDITLAVVGCSLSIPLTIYLQVATQRPIYITVGVVSFLACLAYLTIRRNSLPFPQLKAESTPPIYLLLNIIFFCLLIYGMIGLHLRPELYTRPLGYTEHLFNQSGFLLFFALAFIGSFAMLSRSLRNIHGFALVIGGLVILAINFLGIIFRRSFLAERLDYFLQALLADKIDVLKFMVETIEGYAAKANRK